MKTFILAKKVNRKWYWVAETEGEYPKQADDKFFNTLGLSDSTPNFNVISKERLLKQANYGGTLTLAVTEKAK